MFTTGSEYKRAWRFYSTIAVSGRAKRAAEGNVSFHFMARMRAYTDRRKIEEKRNATT